MPGPDRTAPAGGLRAQLAARLRLLRSFTDFLPTGSGSKLQASAPRPPSTEPPIKTPIEPPTETLSAIWADLDGCTRCRLSEKRQNIVFGVGRPDADLMFIGEGPGGEEDRQGEPFVGPAGEQLNEMIEKCFQPPPVRRLHREHREVPTPPTTGTRRPTRSRPASRSWSGRSPRSAPASSACSGASR